MMMIVIVTYYYYNIITHYSGNDNERIITCSHWSKIDNNGSILTYY